MKIAHVEEEIRGIEQEKKELATELKKKVQKLAIVQSKVDELTNEKDDSETMIKNLMSNVKLLKDQIKLRDPCSFCDKTFEEKSELKVHLKDDHFTSKGTQYEAKTSTEESIQKPSPEESLMEEFLTYKCFYCHRTIMSGEELKNHRKECFTVCSISDAQCRDDMPVSHVELSSVLV